GERRHPGGDRVDEHEQRGDAPREHEAGEEGRYEPQQHRPRPHAPEAETAEEGAEAGGEFLHGTRRRGACGLRHGFRLISGIRSPGAVRVRRGGCGMGENGRVSLDEGAEPRRVAVLGAGSWGTTFAKVLADGGSRVSIWARRPEVAREIMQSHRNSDYLPGINLPDGIGASSMLPEVLEGAPHLILSVPSQSLRENLRIVRELIPDTVPVVSLMKGVEKGTRLRMSEVIQQELDIVPERIAVVSGPNLALEIAKQQPTAAVVSSSSLETASEVALVARNPYFRSFVNTDVIGTEFGGVLKNLIAVAIGIVDGVGYGENTKASIITRGLVEMTD